MSETSCSTALPLSGLGGKIRPARTFSGGLDEKASIYPPNSHEACSRLLAIGTPLFLDTHPVA